MVGLEVEETIGQCKKCKREGYLGDGLCQKCWDKMIGKNRYQVPVPVYNIDGSRVKEQKSYIAIVKCYDCGVDVDYMCEVGRRPTKLKRCRSCNVKRWEDYTRRKNEKIQP